MSDWDPDHAKAETAWTIGELCRRNPELETMRGQPIGLDLQFIPGDGADAEKALRALKMFGYEGRQEEDGIEVTVEGVAFDLDAIWLHEERTARIALSHGYVPDGWGFFEP